MTMLHVRAQVSFHGDYAIVSELQGRVTILDKNNVPVAFIGDNPQQSQWRITSSVPTIFPQAFSVQRMGTI